MGMMHQSIDWGSWWLCFLGLLECWDYCRYCWCGEIQDANKGLLVDLTRKVDGIMTLGVGVDSKQDDYVASIGQL
jgi:hypothetical protein